MQQLIEQLKKAGVGTVLPGELLADYTTWKIGGPADVLIVPSGKQELLSAVRLLQASGVPWTNLGRGSNMLVSDKGIRGVVIKPGEGLDYARFEGNRAIAGAAFSFIKLSVLAGKEGLTGLEFAGGIPGSVGGAVYMNAGAHGADVSRIFHSADIVLETGELVRFGRDDMAFSYRHSVLHETPGVVVEATFELAPGDRKEIAAAMASYKDRRLRTQPLQMACAGSVFRNPTGDYAARLIQEAGLKGYRVGGAEISEQHANFIVNTGQATANDVLTLMDHMQCTVKATFGVDLVPEVLVVGER
ncbi:UDP-N-acetylenolpyruvoylglucosamine reductase [Paenibacillus darwinianus]|uniref:UDP-N-acetylenolpyruvoylglucosamine reductase n=1 Tax=Paenibacillus darwinianus TaxID=1380763 RepID=A0A9W5S441_9BACL|nr:UDP-N-acetylmuramate dehydrogenase [Paenibacillus darwinianus]EXX91694.1 UDP-N-acetylenolpyruvoylglucosamine reductase [Paenibacillus darwinianus]EXX92590.1 UDP-N-acetylenolpyruvoylglucosamine reductase [Paenibacillus darwinianus]EXX92686.1 UDP-N-acetylenolpyruvoylglucosamine reductase [Paenibacillus darwinianus]